MTARPQLVTHRELDQSVARGRQTLLGLLSGHLPLLLQSSPEAQLSGPLLQEALRPQPLLLPPSHTFMRFSTAAQLPWSAPLMCIVSPAPGPGCLWEAAACKACAPCPPFPSQQGEEVAEGRRSRLPLYGHKAGRDLGTLPQSSQNKEGVGLSREQPAFSGKSQRVNISGFAGHLVCVSATYLCCCSGNAASKTEEEAVFHKTRFTKPGGGLGLAPGP